MTELPNKKMRLLLSSSNLSQDAVINLIDILNELITIIENHYIVMLREDGFEDAIEF